MNEIYPKNIHRVKISPKNNCCFLLMPFDPSFDEVYGDIKASLKRIDFDCLRADDIFVNKPIMSNIVCEILANHFIIADMTNKNPNVFYEIGIAHSFRDSSNVI